MASAPTLAQQIAAQNAQSKSLGVVKAVPAASISANLPKTLAYVTVTVPANSKFPVNIRGNYVYLDNISYGSFAALTLKPDTHPGVPLLRLGRDYTFPSDFNFVEIQNPNVSEVTLFFFIGYGKIEGFNNSDAPMWTAQNLVGVMPTTEMTRPNNVTPYAAGQVVGSVGGMNFEWNLPFRVVGGTGTLRKLRLMKSGPSVANASFRMYLKTQNPTAYADQTAFPVTYSNFALTLQDQIAAAVDIPYMVAEGGTGGAFADIDCDIAIVGGSTQNVLNGTLVVQSAYVPLANEKFSAFIWVERN